MLRFLLEAILRRVSGSSRLGLELDEEISSHLDLRTRDLMAAGRSPQDARREAERRFGDLESARRQLRASARRSEGRLRLSDWLDAVRQDVVVASRRILMSPAFSSLSVATFAMGIGLTTTMFALVNAVLLRPLPFPEPDQLVALYSVSEDRAEFPYVSSTNWLDWREQNRSLTATGLYQTDRVSVALADGSGRVPAANVGGPFFETLRAPMLIGRPFSAAEADDRAPVAVVSERFWHRYMSADPSLGDLVIGGVERTVIGVLEDRHAFPEGTDVWVPAVYRRMSGEARNNISWFAVGRLAPGVTPQAARDDLDRIAATIRDEAPEAWYSWGVGVVPLHRLVVGDAEVTLALLMGAVITVLLIACANLAGQAYARSLSNVESAAVRLALGATRARVLQHQAIEHLLLALAGGAVGLALCAAVTAWVGTHGLPLPRAESLAVDWRVATFAIAVSVVAGLLAGLAPALRVARSTPRAAMGSVRGAGSGARAGAAGFLVGAEVAMAVVLLVGGGLLVRSVVGFASRDMGFDPHGVLVAQIELDGPAYDDDASRLAFWDRALDEARTLSGTASAALASEVPGEDVSGYGVVRLADDPDREDAAATYRVVSDGWFATLGLPLVAGRDFAPTDGTGAERVVIVSRAFADSYWPRKDAIGSQLQAISMESVLGSPPLTVVGVVADVDNGTGVEARPAMYVVHRQVPFWTRVLSVAIRPQRGDPRLLAAPLIERVRAIDDTRAADVATIADHFGELLARDRLVMSILNGFALLALGLAAIGVHGLLSFAVARRTREIAVRSALGATRGRILRMVVGDAVRIAIAGSAAGVIGAWWLTRYLEALLVGVSPRDPLTFGLVVATLLAVTIAAAWLPALRAVRLDPSVALRSD